MDWFEQPERSTNPDRWQHATGPQLLDTCGKELVEITRDSLNSK